MLNGIHQVCDAAGISLAEVAQVLHGTTVATNAILEGKGATVGLVTTSVRKDLPRLAPAVQVAAAGVSRRLATLQR